MNLLLLAAIIIVGVVFWKIVWKLLVIGALVTFIWEIVLIVQDLHHMMMR